MRSQVPLSTSERNTFMMRMKIVFAVLMLAAIASIVPEAQASTCTALATPCVQVVIAGSSAMWQTMALGAYNNGNATAGIGSVAPTFHWTSASNKVNLNDARPTPVNSDPGTLWIVWDSHVDSNGAAAPNVWAYLKVDSVVGDRCYFAQPRCTEIGAAADLAAAGAGQIATALWGADTNLPASVQTLFTTGSSVNIAATDIRPEDAAFAECRVNSKLGASTIGGALSDGTDGLGYGTKPAGYCPVKADPQSAKVGTPIKSGVIPATGATANVLAFNITGTDPFTGTTIPPFTVYAAGAAPIVFVTERDKGQLGSLKNATEIELQNVFSGKNCDASAFAGLAAGGINIFLREPLSGTMNTTEATVFRRPTTYPKAPGVLGLSQEENVGSHNPLSGDAGTCLAGAGHRYRGIGTGEVVNNGVKVSGSAYPNAVDGIAYTFFSYGNVSKISNSASYGYIQLNGIDPIFQTFGSTLDPGQPASAGTLPAAANLPATCAGGVGSFPCNEVNIWKNGFSFPNLRNGTYRAWSLLRLVVTAGQPESANASNLVKASNVFVVTSVPDYVPAVAVAGTPDLGLKLLRSHYQQKAGNGANLGFGPVGNSPEKGGDMGGYILPTTIGVTTYKQIQLIQNATPDNSSLGPVARP